MKKKLHLKRLCLNNLYCYSKMDFDSATIWSVPNILNANMWTSKRKHYGQSREKYCENIEDTPGGNHGEHCLHWLSITQSFNQWFIFPEGINFFQGSLLIFLLPASPRICRYNFCKIFCTFLSRVFAANSHWTLVRVGPNKVGDLQPESCCLPHWGN